MKQLITLLLAFFLVPVSWSQEPGQADGPATRVNDEIEAEVAEAGETDDAGEVEEDSELDEQGYGLEEEEDDFMPSEEVSADQSLPFPVDI